MQNRPSKTALSKTEEKICRINNWRWKVNQDQTFETQIRIMIPIWRAPCPLRPSAENQILLNSKKTVSCPIICTLIKQNKSEGRSSSNQFSDHLWQYVSQKGFLAEKWNFQADEKITWLRRAIKICVSNIWHRVMFLLTLNNNLQPTIPHNQTRCGEKLENVNFNIVTLNCNGVSHLVLNLENCSLHYWNRHKILIRIVWN